VPSGPEAPTLPVGEFVEATDCKWYQFGPAEYETPPNLDCIAYTYSGDSTLILKHVNAAFNCCPGGLFATFTFKDSLITIEEHESDALCDCVCLYDLDFEVRHLAPGMYVIKVIEPYVGDHEEQLEFRVDLTAPTSGTYCVERDTYPWNIPIPDPSGTLVDYSGCKMFRPAGPDSFDYSGKECIQYSYDNDFSLRFLHINACFNCCPGSIHGSVSIDGGTIAIRERQEINGCRCMCLYDLDFLVYHVPPGVYQVTAYWGDATEPSMQFFVDLSVPTSGIHCEERDSGPYGP
jgi:hypothetical protein